MKDKPIIGMAHSDDFRWFGPPDMLDEWKLLVTTFNKHWYEATDATNKEFVGIHIYHDERFNYYMDQERMITSIAKEANISGDRDEHIPAPMEGLAFDKALYHQSQGFPTQDPVLMYRDLKDYFYGRDNNGINAARAALTRYKINPTVSLKADITIFEETLKNVEYAANEIITENIRLSFLDEKFCHDTRLGVRERLTHCQCSFFTYAATMDALKNTPNASVTPGNHSRMNNFQQVKSKDLCNNSLKGQCTYGEKCKYVHGDPAKGDTAKGGIQGYRRRPANSATGQAYKAQDARTPSLHLWSPSHQARSHDRQSHRFQSTRYLAQPGGYPELPPGQWQQVEHAGRQRLQRQ